MLTALSSENITTTEGSVRFLSRHPAFANRPPDAPQNQKGGIKGRFMVIFLIMITGSYGTARVTPDDLELKVRKIAGRYRTAIEKHTGYQIPRRPPIRVSDRATIAKLNVRQMENFPSLFTYMLKNYSEEQIKEVLRQQGEMMSSRLLGQYLLIDGSVHVVPENVENFRKNSGLDEESTDDILTAVIIHELVHYVQDKKYDVFSRVGPSSGSEESFSLNTLLEGHADYVTELVLKDAGYSEDNIVRLVSHGNATNPVDLAGVYKYTVGKNFLKEVLHNDKISQADVINKPPFLIRLMLYPDEYMEYLGSEDWKPVKKMYAGIDATIEAGIGKSGYMKAEFTLLHLKALLDFYRLGGSASEGIVRSFSHGINYKTGLGDAGNTISVIYLAFYSDSGSSTLYTELERLFKVDERHRSEAADTRKSFAIRRFTRTSQFERIQVLLAQRKLVLIDSTCRNDVNAAGFLRDAARLGEVISKAIK